MRPRYLEIEGLQSFRDMQAIDFDRLSETGLFGIFGPTGSGKSTILDAVTLALYGNVQRATRGTQGIMNTAVNSMRVSFTFDLVKGSERKTYKVERVYRRKKDSQNSIEAKLVRLLEVTPGGEVVIADKQSEVNDGVINLLGLQFDDFTRSVVLPQNKFQEFLLAQKAEKTKMLERIFYLEEYGRQLADKINRKLSQVRNRLSGIEGAVSMLGNVSEEALKEAEADFRSAEEHRRKADERLAGAEKEYDAAREVWELVVELEDVLKKEQEQLLRTDEIAAKKSTYEKSRSAAALMDKIRSCNITSGELKKTEEELRKLDAELEGLEKAIGEKAEEYERASRTRKESIPKLIEYRTKLLKALDTGKEIDRLETALQKLRADYTEIKKKISERDEVISDLKNRLETALKEISEQKSLAETLKVDAKHRSLVQKGVRLEEELNNSNKGLELQKTKLEAQAKSIFAQQQELLKLEEYEKKLQEEALKLEREIEQHGMECPGDRNEISREETGYYSIKAVSDSLKLKERELDTLQGRLQALSFQAEELRKHIDETEKLRENKLSELAESKLLLEEKRREHQRNTAFILAQELKENEPCPVCGSTDHPRPALCSSRSSGESVEKELKELQRVVDKLDAEARSLEGQCIKLREQHRNLMQQIEILKDDIGKNEEDRRQWTGKLPEELQPFTSDALEKHLEDEKVKRQQRLKTLEAWELKQKELEEKREELQDKVNRHNIDISSRRSGLNADKAHFEQAKEALEAAEAENRRIFGEYKAYIDGIGVSGIKEELERIQSCDSRFETLQKSIAALEDSASGIRKQLEAAETERQKLAAEFSEIDAEGRGLKYQKEEKLKEIKELLGDKDINSEIAGTDAEIERISAYEQQVQEQLNELRKKYEEGTKEKKALEKQGQIYGSKLEAEESELNKALQDKGFASKEEAEQSVVPEEAFLQLERELRDYEEAKRNLEVHKGVVSRKLKGRSITREQWQAVSSTYDELKQEKEASISAYEAAKNRYDTIKSNYESWLVLGKEMQTYTKKLEHLEQLKSLMKGNGFIEYISEERLRYVAREASETLGTLTRYRYGLELDIDNGFVIRDNANGGIQRMVTSLSGGETFLTSLSLALALSSQIQLKGQSPLEFFFLDEGFGTLDNNLLDTVVDALERLSTQKRVIGLISHVPELRDRIARRLIVEPPTINGVGSRVCIEKA